MSSVRFSIFLFVVSTDLYEKVAHRAAIFIVFEMSVKSWL